MRVSASPHVGLLGLVTVCIRGTAQTQLSGAINHSFVEKQGSVSIFPAGLGPLHAKYSKNSQQVCVVEIESGPALDLLPEKDSLRKLNPQVCIQDQHVERLVLNMRSAIREGCWGGALYGQSLSMALVAHVWGRYAGMESRHSSSFPKFNQEERERIESYIRAHLHHDFSLVEIANALEFSPRHFFRLFKNTFGSTPYQYVLQKRIDKAKVLLTARRLPITEIAARLGFVDQSHFTVCFRNATSLTPKSYQRQS